jgi:hypothetical protein
VKSAPDVFADALVPGRYRLRTAARRFPFSPSRIGSHVRCRESPRRRAASAMVIVSPSGRVNRFLPMRESADQTQLFYRSTERETISRLRPIHPDA